MSTQKSYRKKLRQLAKLYNVKYRIRDMAPDGLVHMSQRFIILNKGMSARRTFSAFFHELGHIYAYDNDIYKVFHNVSIRPTEREKRIYKMTAYRAELWVDRWAEKEFSKHFQDVKYFKGYGIDPEYEKSYLREYHSYIYT